MNKIAGIIADYLLRQDVIEYEDYDIYHYGVVSGLELLLCLAVNLFAAVLAGWVLELLVFVLLFAPLRSYIGGIHMKSYPSCLICTTLLVHIVLAVSINYVFPIYALMFSYIFCIALLLIVLNRQVKKESSVEMLYYKDKAVKILFSSFVIFMGFIFCRKYAFMNVLIGVLVIALVSLLPVQLKKTNICDKVFQACCKRCNGKL